MVEEWIYTNPQATRKKNPGVSLPILLQWKEKNFKLLNIFMREYSFHKSFKLFIVHCLLKKKKKKPKPTNAILNLVIDEIRTKVSANGTSYFCLTR